MSLKEGLISHRSVATNLQDTISAISERIKECGDKEHVTVAEQLNILHELSEFEFGQFLLQNQGVNGYWTHYMLTHPWFGRKTGKNNRGMPFTVLERFILDRGPIMLATQQRFAIFLRENQKAVHNGAKLASIPCGLMGELLYLNFKNIDQIELVGLDYDPQTLEDAQDLAKKQRVSQFATFIQKDAWHINLHNEFDLISSNGLNIYEPDKDRVVNLYRQFHTALKPGGKLVTSFLSYPPHAHHNSEWLLEKINPKDLLLERIIFADIIHAKFQCFSSTQETEEQLQLAGFKRIRFYFDECHIFPTVVAEK
ncbi:Exported protein [Legionella lansingensis]|uniref:Methyltransferase domain protein n=2 Tax=Legionella lansingensis TaxID=45067 RepID=A0A0W0VLD9_9GAMM|nr:Methyltransferase domain protein [Legionella lansingensis]SNV44178.1 Exported protein [Legionella lansingensis]